MALKEEFLEVRKRILAHHESMEEHSQTQKLIDENSKNVRRLLDDIPVYNPKNRKLVGFWFLASAFMVLLTISMAGIGRMTEAGLNLVDFEKFRGSFPPLTLNRWKDEYVKYTKRPDFVLNTTKLTHPNQTYPTRVMKLSEFEIGVVGLAMNSIGMDPCGSTDKDFPRIKHYRLSFYLISGFSLYASLLWAGLSTIFEPHNLAVAHKTRLRAFAYFTTGALFFTFVYGTLVAGTDAGLIYNNWPFYDTTLFYPPKFFELSPWWRNLFDSRSTIQWFHRHAAYFSTFCVACLWLYAVNMNIGIRGKMVLHALLACTMVQGILGVLNLWFRTPALLAILHQNTNVLIQTAAIWFCNELRNH
uniref:Uncharacterized protein n=1 Tax=Acrobeloides nanus TaxID=290746 RepID=A0A914CDH5_9BILA